MDIQVLSKSSNWMDTIWAAIRTCKSAEAPAVLFAKAGKTDYDKKLRLLLACRNAGHLSVFEHASITFAVEGVSRALLAQYTRHRHISFSVQSQRYVTMSNARFVMPPGMDYFELHDPLWLGDFAGDIIADFVEGASRVYDHLLREGVKPEDARFILPNGMACNFVTSMNLRAFIELYEKRVATKGAQWEIRQMVEHMAELIQETEPWTRALFE